MSEIYTWSVSAASNNAAVPNGWPENMNYSAVNDCGREMMAAIARHLKDNDGSITTGGTGNAYTLMTNRTIPSYVAGLRIAFKADRMNTGAATLNVNALGARNLTDVAGQTLRWADIRQNGFYDAIYDGSAFRILNIDTSVEFTGKIAMFSGSTGSIPAGWRLCNGSSGTPDLRNRFVVGAGSTYAVGATGGAASVNTGSSGAHTHTTASAGGHSHAITVNNHTLTIGQVPPHRHDTVTAANWSTPYGTTSPTTTRGLHQGLANYPGIASDTVGGGGAHNHGASSSFEAAHTHTVNSAGAHTHSVATLPPYYAVCFIMRTAA